MSAQPSQLPMIAEPSDLNPVQLLQMAVQRGVDTEQLKALMELQKDWKAEKAREAFHHAMNAFRAESINIVKSKPVAFGNTSYKHATLADTVEASVPFLSKHGLSHRWETKQDGAGITVSCIVTHELGHSAQTSLTAPPDTSGAKNSIQAIGSTVSYLQRYTFMAITGLAAKDTDDDAQTAGGGETIDEDQAANLLALIEEVGANKAAFLKTCKVERIEDLPASKYEGAVKRLEAKRVQ